MEFNVDISAILAISATQLGLGMYFGWLWRGSRVSESSSGGEMIDTELHAKRLRDALHKLHALTGAIEADVDKHAKEVADIGQGLGQQAVGEGQLQDRILAAVSQITQANDRLQVQLNSAEQRLKEQTTLLESQMAEARTDALTGLANRRAFDDELMRRLSEFQRYKVPMALLLADVDHFKSFNDTHGHLAGDEVLRGVAKVLQNAMREVDVVCRYGGEEFAVIFPCTRITDVGRAAERARRAVENAVFEFEGRQLQVTFSGGLSDVLASDTPEKIIKRADDALYAAKKAGRNRCFVNSGKEIGLLEVEMPTPPAAAAAADDATVAALAAPAAEAAQAKVDAQAAEVAQALAESQVSPALPAEPQNEVAAPVAKAQAVEPGLPAPTVIDNSRLDPLTGLPTQEVFHDELRRRLAESKRLGTPLCLVLANVDRMSEVVERHGRPMSDVALRAITKFFTAALRDMDLVARYDTDRFAILLPNADLGRATHVAERIRRAIELCKLRLGAAELHLTISAGVAQLLEGEDGSGFIRRCAGALHASKQSGCNAVHVHDGEHCVASEPVDSQSAAATR